MMMPAWLTIMALACCSLLTAPFPSFAQSKNNTAAPPTSSSSVTSLPRGSQEKTQQQKTPPSTSVPSLQDLGFSPAVTRGSAREQALLNRRSHMLQLHQKLGLLTTIPLVATVFTGPGAKGHHGRPGSPTGRDVHAGLGILTTGMYFTSAYYAIRAPKVPGVKTRGNVRLHKAMAWIHGPGMVITPILGAIAFSQVSKGERVHGIAKYHAWAAYATAGAYGVAILSVSLNKF